MFHMFKKKEDSPPQQQVSNSQQPIEQDYYQYGTSVQPQPKKPEKIESWRRKFNFFGGSD